ncbi:MAG: CopG family transcriptional regulator [Spirochaetales bacterium]|nr:CopG family transcriptional regulator [Spirochaetales bacterium]
MTTIRLNEDLNNKLSTLIEIEKSTKTEIIKKALTEYYEHHVNEKSPYELGMELFGRYGNDENLSTNYKSKLKRKLHEKHTH